MSAQVAWLLAGPLMVLPSLPKEAAHGSEGPPTSAARQILATYCHRCHGQGSKARGGMDYILDRDLLVARNQIEPGLPDESPLYQKVLSGAMPPPSEKLRPRKEDVQVLERWIRAGAPWDGSPAKGRAMISEADALRRMVADLEALPANRRRHMRYFTLTHLANAGVAEAVLESHRRALGKLLNSLSWHPDITLPRTVDPAGTVLRIDLRAYKQPDRKWDARLWERLVSQYPYRPPDRSPLAGRIAALAGSELAYLRGDWFVATASRPPLYQDLLQLPGSDRSLERMLQVDVRADLDDESAVRAGFNHSGVARNNRLIERHTGAFGAYWRSYDFSANTGRQNLFEHPLGPESGRSSFEHAGGEMIFRLPNGLYGFMLVNGRGLRVDRAPVEIVSDPRRPDRQVETGLSCMSCHARGLIAKADQIRAHVEKNRRAFARADVETVKALYVPEEQFKSLIEKDVNGYLRALAKTASTAADPEPITAVTHRYEASLDLGGAAAEMGLAPQEFQRRLARSATLSRTFGPLNVRGGTVQRQVFEETFVDISRQLMGVRDGLAGPASPDARLAKPTSRFSGHEGSVACLAIAPDGRRALSGGADKTLRLWDVGSGQLLRTLHGHIQEITCVAFSPDGRRSLTGGRDRTLRLWDMGSGKELACCLGHTAAVCCVAFSPDGQRAISGGEDRTVRMWDLHRGREIACWEGHAGKVCSLDWSADGRLAVSGSHDRTVRLWDTGTGRELRRLVGHTREVLAVAIARDGSRVVSGGNDRMVRVWEVASGRQLHALRGHANGVIRVAFCGGKILSAASQYQSADKLIRLWDGVTGKALGQFGGDPKASVHYVAFAPDGRSALAAGADRYLHRWKLWK
jgi:hypothetical protein